MKKLFSALLLAMAIASNSQAASSIVIDNAKAPAVLSFSTEFYGTLNPEFAVVKTDAKSAILAAKRKDAEGNDYLEQVRFVVSQKEENVGLSMETVNTKTNNGKTEFQPVSKPGPERIVLATVKTLFNDHYSFGYILSSEYKDGGFVIDGMEQGAPALEAGMKAGDILTHVNKKPIMPEDEGLYNDKALPACFTGKATEFTVLRNGEVKTFKVTPSYEPALLR